MNTAQTINGEIKVGDWIIAAPSDDYGYLIGTVIEINKLGTPAHMAETDNETDSVHVNFLAFDYPPERIAEIEERFSELYGIPKRFDEIPLDDVIMSPDELICITELGMDEIIRMGNLRQNCEAFCNCFPEANSIRNQLYDRISAEYDAFTQKLETLPPKKIIEASFEKVFKEDILMSFEGDFLNNEQIAALISLEQPLDSLYLGWLDSDISYMDDLRDCIGYTADFYVAEQKKELLSQPKRSIADRLAKGKEKADAYKEQQAQNPTKATKYKEGIR